MREAKQDTRAEHGKDKLVIFLAIPIQTYNINMKYIINYMTRSVESKLLGEIN